MLNQRREIVLFSGRYRQFFPTAERKDPGLLDCVRKHVVAVHHSLLLHAPSPRSCLQNPTCGLRCCDTGMIVSPVVANHLAVIQPTAKLSGG